MSETIRMCNVEIKVDGDEFIAVITHHLPPLGDNRSEVPPKELRCHSKEDLFTEVVKYLGDCYEE